jgi:hypothetical protein
LFFTAVFQKTTFYPILFESELFVFPDLYSISIEL